MKTYIALGESSGNTGSLIACQSWASNKLEMGEEHYIHIVCCRAGENHCRLAFEVSQNGLLPVTSNVAISLMELKPYA